jgi:biopolymer transport protein ExbB
MLSLLIRGGPVMVPLAFCSVLALAVIVERLWFYTGVARETARFSAALERHDPQDREGLKRLCAGSQAPLARVILAGLKHGNPHSESAAERQAATEVQALERYLPALDSIVTLAPLLGLFGTVTGMIRSFGVLAREGIARPHMVTGGVAEALVATATGLVIAIVAFAAHAWLQRMAEYQVFRMETVAGEILERGAVKP